MKEAEFADHLLMNDRYETFKHLIGELSARWSAAELAHGSNAVTLRNGRVEYEPSMVFMEHGTRHTQDVEAEWERILGICRQFGFQPKA